MQLSITLFIFIIVFCGTDDIQQNIPTLGLNGGIYGNVYGILSVPHNTMTVMDVNML